MWEAKLLTLCEIVLEQLFLNNQYLKVKSEQGSEMQNTEYSCDFYCILIIYMGECLPHNAAPKNITTRLCR